MTAAVRKAVFPVAGLGTRTLPATKITAKEMLPVVDKPIIQYAAEEATGAGITELIFVVSRGKGSIREHFSPAPDLEAELRAKGKQDALASIRDIVPPGVVCRYVIQERALGLGHAVLCAREAVGDEPFAVLLPDDLIDNGANSCLRQLLAAHRAHGASVIAVENVAREHTDRYGIVEPQPFADRLHRIRAIVEKPKPERAPSTLAVVGRYVLAPEIWSRLEGTRSGAGGEIQLTDAIGGLLGAQTVLALEFEGSRYDCGTKLGLLQANVALALKDRTLGAPLRRYLRSLDLGGG